MVRIKINIKRKAYSSKVEQTAHNGWVVGSNPTKPKRKTNKNELILTKNFICYSI